ncbi:MAG: ABC transporter permease [Planctomycetota bacterium]
MRRLGLVIAVVGLGLAAMYRWLDFPPRSIEVFGLPLQPVAILLWYAVGVTGVMCILRACQEAAGQRDALTRLLASPAGAALIAFVLVLYLGLLFPADEAFYKLGTHRDALRQASVYGILACGMTLVIITGGIDLAVGSILALVAVSFSLMSIHWGWSPLLAVPLAIAIGAACGGVSGTLTAKFRIQPFIATLAMMVFARGLAKLTSGGMKISTAVQNADGTYDYVDVPGVFRAIDSRILGDNLSVVTVIFLVCAAVAWVALARHRWGRELYAIGGNEEAARLSGVPVVTSKILAYVACGALAAVAGICQAAQEQQGDPEAGTAYELSAIAIVVIGGTNLMGGRGGIGLTLIGMLTIGYLEKILSINAVPEAGRLMLTGVIIVAAVLTQRRRRW